MRRLISIVIATLALVGCATTRYVEEGQYLLRRVSIVIDSPTRHTPLPSDLMSYVGQRPNRKLFGIFDWSLGIYNLNKRSSNGWLHRQLRQWGDAPVIFSQQEADYSTGSLSSALYNLGYLRASTALRIDTIAPRKVHATYYITLGPRYYVAHHEERIADTAIRALLHPADTLVAKSRFPSEQYASFLAPGSPLAPEAMQAERRRITQILRNRGYWDFREERIRFDVDTLEGPREAWVHTIIADSSARTYTIGAVRMKHALPEEPSTLAPIDTVYRGEVAVLRGSSHRLRSRVLAGRSQIAPGSLYSQDAIGRTYAALSDLGAIRSVLIQHHADTTDSLRPRLDVDIITTPERSKELVTDLVGTHSGGNFGANASLSLSHNNIFGGAEQFKLLGRVGYEELTGEQSNHLRYGVEATLSFPRLLVPFYSLRRQRPIHATTALSLSYDYQTRPEFRRDVLSAGWSYSWTNRNKPAFGYTFKLLEVDYMHFGYMDADFISTIPAYARMLSYRDQFIVSSSLMMRYSSSKDYRRASSPLVHNLRLYAQSAGNVLYAISSLSKSPKDAYGAYSFMNINYAQFVRAEIDYSGLYRLGGKNGLAYHAAVSVVSPYGNSDVLPVDLRYFSGGSASVRGWSARSLGPGSMARSVGTSIFHQVGDLKIDLSAELRLRFARSWEFATFVDAGNIWTIKAYESQPNGEFRFGCFYRELALASGLGLRWDFDYFLLRLDAGIKVYDPQADPGLRWSIGRRPLRDLVAIHFALGYPF